MIVVVVVAIKCSVPMRRPKTIPDTVIDCAGAYVMNQVRSVWDYSAAGVSRHTVLIALDSRFPGIRGYSYIIRDYWTGVRSLASEVLPLTSLTENDSL